MKFSEKLIIALVVLANLALLMFFVFSLWGPSSDPDSKEITHKVTPATQSVQKDAKKALPPKVLYVTCEFTINGGRIEWKKLIFDSEDGKTWSSREYAYTLVYNKESAKVSLYYMYDCFKGKSDPRSAPKIEHTLSVKERKDMQELSADIQSTGKPKYDVSLNLGKTPDNMYATFKFSDKSEELTFPELGCCSKCDFRGTKVKWKSHKDSKSEAAHKGCTYMRIPNQWKHGSWKINSYAENPLILCLSKDNVEKAWYKHESLNNGRMTRRQIDFTIPETLRVNASAIIPDQSEIIEVMRKREMENAGFGCSHWWQSKDDKWAVAFVPFIPKQGLVWQYQFYDMRNGTKRVGELPLKDTHPLLYCMNLFSPQERAKRAHLTFPKQSKRRQLMHRLAESERFYSEECSRKL